MGFIGIWSGFILSLSFFEELNQYLYFFLSLLMFGLTYVSNQMNPLRISLKLAIIIFNVPGLMLWYLAFVYNDFLAINPVSYELFMSIFFIYCYLLLYILLNKSI